MSTFDIQMVVLTVNSKQALEFFATQAAHQAEIDRVSLSELEKRMLYFTEGPDRVYEPIQPNEEFEAAYEMEEYEAKVSKLLNGARKRIRSHNPLPWDEALNTLRQGDYYVLVMLE